MRAETHGSPFLPSRSRSEYYHQYTRENLSQESDCLTGDDAWNAQSVGRYLYLLRRGEEHRKWLLSDMQFEDPVHSTNEKRLDDFETKAMALVRSGNDDTAPSVASNTDSDSEGDGWSTDEDDTEERSLPSWYKNPQRR